jgi:hypothetical protein
LAVPRTSAWAVSQELIRALLMKVSSDLIHCTFSPSSGETEESANWKATPGSAEVTFLRMFLNSWALMCENEPPKASMPPQPART